MKKNLHLIIANIFIYTFVFILAFLFISVCRVSALSKGETLYSSGETFYYGTGTFLTSPNYEYLSIDTSYNWSDLYINFPQFPKGRYLFTLTYNSSQDIYDSVVAYSTIPSGCTLDGSANVVNETEFTKVANGYMICPNGSTNSPAFKINLIMPELNSSVSLRAKGELFMVDDLSTSNQFDDSNIINNQNQNKDEIINNQNSNTDKITENQSQNTDKIIENQDKNKQDIIDNQNQLNEDTYYDCEDNLTIGNYAKSPYKSQTSMHYMTDFDTKETIPFDTNETKFTVAYDLSNISKNQVTDVILRFTNGLEKSSNGRIYGTEYHTITIPLKTYLQQNPSASGWIYFTYDIPKFDNPREHIYVFNQTYYLVVKDWSSIPHYMIYPGTSKTNKFVSYLTPQVNNKVCKNKLDSQLEKQDETNKKLDEQNETSKGILGKIGDLFNEIINLPKKLIELLLEVLKSLFIPSDDYFTNKFNEIKELVESNLGVLAYPLTIAIDTFEFMLTIEDTGSYVISWPNVVVPNFNFVIIPAGSFDLSIVLQNGFVNMAHSLYMTFVSAYLILSFVKFCQNKYADMFGGDYDNTDYMIVEDSIVDVYENDDGSKKYVNHRERRYKVGDDE